MLNAEASLNRLTLMVNATASQTDGPATNRGFHAEENDLRGVLNLGIVPIGSLVGGFLGEAVGLRQTMVLGMAGDMLTFLCLAWSPFIRLRQPPSAAD